MKRFWRWGFVAIAATVVIASVLAYAGAFVLRVPGLPNADFFGHLVFIGALAFFADGLVAHRTIGARALRIGPLLVFAVAATDEAMQRFSSHRSSSLSDLVADTIGIAIGAFLASRVARATSRACPRPAP